ncbi:FecR family protein [Chryseobacterium viscerum]|uniref:Histidine kinase n=1 Tax=Chryseobacterium viscerum TaxID=1037377 RepID=A0A316WSF7_9FLAO|nr:FecR family protein [Chryseobacterium viscerum]PWN64139.1 histidine kinase [Chryseobacterium viscerum]
MDGKKTRLQPPTPDEQQLMWENIKKSIDIKERRKHLVRIVSVAATLILLSVGSVIGYNMLTAPYVYLAEARDSTIKLADGSVIKLLKGARLTVEKSFPANTREVYLEGDAIFKVAKSKDHPFIVHGLNYETRVLGTVFKVVQDGTTFKVDLFEGRVAVKKTNTKEEYFMAPGKTFSNYGKPHVATITGLKEDRNKPDLYEADNSLILLSFNESSVKDAIEVIEKTYQVKVEYPAKYADHKISLSNTNVSPAAILGTIAAHLDLNLNIDDTTYRLEK